MILPDLEILHPTQGVAVVVLSGEHDLTTKDALLDLLSSLVTANSLVVVDVTDAKFIDSSFINNLGIADRAAKEHESRLVLQMGTAPIVRRALEISGVLPKLDCASSREEALGR